MDIVLIDAAISYGCEKKGCELAFEKLENAGLFEMVKKQHNLVKVERILSPYRSAKTMFNEHPKLKYLDTVINVNEKIKATVYNSLKHNNFPIIIGGDHSLAIGSIAGASKHYNKLAVIYIDAHADMNTTQTSISHNIHGMSLAVALNYGEKKLRDIFSQNTNIIAKDVYHIGGRDIEPLEQKLADDLNMKFYNNELIKKQGSENVVNQVISKIQSEKYDGVHLSFDIDILDATLVKATGTPVVDGLSLIQVKEMLKAFLDTGMICSIDFVEYNPLLDDKQNSTLEISLEILKTIFTALK